jgi:hypothetical protein
MFVTHIYSIESNTYRFILRLERLTLARHSAIILDFELSGGTAFDGTLEFQKARIVDIPLAIGVLHAVGPHRGCILNYAT